jgi:hypothetical protein
MASPQLLLLMCPLKLVDAMDLLQAGHFLVRATVVCGGGDGADEGGGRDDKEDEGMAAAA